MRIVTMILQSVTLRGLQALHHHTLTELSVKAVNASLKDILSTSVINSRSEKTLQTLCLTDFAQDKQDNNQTPGTPRELALDRLARNFLSLSVLTLNNVDLQNSE